MSVRSYPRVLILGETFDTLRGGGITLSNLFKDWPKERIAVADSGEHFYASPICSRYYRLGSLEDRWVWPLSYIRREGKVSGPVQEFYEALPRSSTDISESAAGAASLKHISRRGFYAVVDFLGTGELWRRLNLSPSFLRWVADFQPEVVYTQLSTLNMIRLTTQLIKALDLPVVIHLMDDWLSTEYRQGVLSPYVRWRMDVEFRSLVDRASALLGISHKMCQAFQERYQRPFLPFHNPIELDSWRNFAKTRWESHNPFRLLYAGRIGIANRLSLMDVCDTVAKLRTAGMNIRMDLFILGYTPELQRTYQRPGCVFVNPTLPYQEVPKTLVEADALLLPLDFDAQSIQFARYSLPTKATEYMAAGTPVLVYAPREMAVAEYAQRENWGYVVNEQSPELLSKAIVQLMEDDLLRENLGRRAQALAIQNHDAARVRDAFRETLAQASAK